jgi:hypothetical protein
MAEVDEDESLTRQVLNMVLENNAVMPWLVGWMVFNIVIFILMTYVAVRITLK